MLGLRTPIHSPIPSISRISCFHPQRNILPPSFPLKTCKKTYSKFLLFSQTNNNNNHPLSQEPKEEEQGQKNGSSNKDDDLKKDQLPPVLNIKWGDLLLNPDPDNILAVGLTGLLTWASVQVLWQLFAISLAILVAALKYSFIAALLIFILITLL